MRIRGLELVVTFDAYPMVKSTKGSLIAFEEPERCMIQISINDVVSTKNVVEACGRCKEGDPVYICAVQPPAS
jgi:hypothetical protein